MADLTKDEVIALGHAVGLEIQDPDLTEVTYSLNALLQSLDQINPPGLDTVEPLPIILPPNNPTT
jgi:Asp-tRNA(Asn)/Glu-tRNA(Gln) amidotransferase C subunit